MTFDRHNLMVLGVFACVYISKQFLGERVCVWPLVFSASLGFAMFAVFVFWLLVYMLVLSDFNVYKASSLREWFQQLVIFVVSRVQSRLVYYRFAPT
mmetsp:Transcript_15252/g.26425  ORF Transcript_15252/g.26425 Transcript_15252/m.26425 type:complete len:97 (+) Transcript_15252:941-1231(+)